MHNLRFKLTRGKQLDNLTVFSEILFPENAVTFFSYVERGLGKYKAFETEG